MHRGIRLRKCRNGNWCRFINFFVEENQMKTLLVSSVVGFAITGVAAAAELQSGLQVGDRAGYFEVKDVTGPKAGQSLCYR